MMLISTQSLVNAIYKNANQELAINVENVINKYYGMKNCQIIITGDGAK